ncbi:MAG: acetate kinase [Oscillospiraceae bacterium]|nr:acetate kinase [Oscillospiraceae bacterium]
MKILIINAGSSSLKYQLMDMDSETVMAKGLCERIGIDGKFTYKPQIEGKAKIDAADVPMPTHAEAIKATLDALVDPQNGVIASMSEIGACGHRVLHGGMEFTQSCLVDDKCIAAIKKCFPLGPLHNPANLTGILACQDVMPGVPQIAVFDTAFHQTMPEKAYIYALPYEYFEKYQCRRYGFHGTSHRYIARHAAEFMGGDPAKLKIISCHLGNGSSLCAIDGGKCVDTSMGLTPLAGVPMGTRCGSVDPSVIKYICDQEGITYDDMDTIMNKKSGVLGVSGVSSDFRDLGDAAEQGNKRAQLALDIFHYEVAKTIGAYAAAMNGVDGIVFTAGIGENSPYTRAEICKYLGYLGAELDPELNALRGDNRYISTADSRVKLMVIPTNEELVIARDTVDIVNSL